MLNSVALLIISSVQYMAQVESKHLLENRVQWHWRPKMLLFFPAMALPGLQPSRSGGLPLTFGTILGAVGASRTGQQNGTAGMHMASTHVYGTQMSIIGQQKRGNH